MNFIKSLRSGALLGGAAVAFAGACLTQEARANVYATNIKLNSGTNNVTVGSGVAVSISYILNEPASAGASIKILSGTNVVRTINLASGNAGTLKGANTVSWDGKNDSNNNVPGGVYAISITPSATGYTNWTQITSDSNPGNYVYEPRGIGVNRSPFSPYYGRVYVGNSSSGPNPGGNPGDAVGIQKLNADGSSAEEGSFSTGGHGWAGDQFSPWKIEVAQNGNVYINDWTGQGEIYRWDPTLSTNSMLQILRPDNWGNGGAANLSGPAVNVLATNHQIWMADISYPGSTGIIRYNADLDGACVLNDTGVTVVGAGGDLSLYPYDVALDHIGNIYTIQFRSNPDDPAARVLRFPAYDPSTNGMLPLLQADWAIGGAGVNGGGDNTMGGANGIAVDPSGTYVAVAFRGIVPVAGRTNANTRIFYATNGAEVFKIDTGFNHDHVDVTWDAVGNLYDLDNRASRWRAYSPPGANQATTVALNTIQVDAPAQAPSITSISVSGGTATIDFSGAAGDAATAFTLQSATDITGTFIDVAGANISLIGPGQFRATTVVSGASKFYRIKR